MGIVIIPPVVQRTDSHPPAAILIPAHGLHGPRLYGHNGCPQGTHQVIAQMLPGKAIASPYAEVVTMAVAVAGGNGRKGLEPVGGFPNLLPPVVLHQNGIISHKPPQGRIIGLVVIGIIFEQLSQKLLRALTGLQILIGLFHRFSRHLPPGPAGSQSQQINPAHRHILLLGPDIQSQSLIHGFIGDVKVHPFDVILRSMDRTHQKRQNQNHNKKPPSHVKPPPWYCAKRWKLYARKIFHTYAAASHQSGTFYFRMSGSTYLLTSRLLSCIMSLNS